MGLIDEKNRESKISCYCPFKEGFLPTFKKKPLFHKLSMYNAECAPYRIGLIYCIRKIVKCHTFSVQALLFDDQRKF
jgi:hypothetical protein